MHGGYAKNIGAGARKIVLHDLSSLTIRIYNHYVLLHSLLLSHIRLQHKTKSRQTVRSQLTSSSALRLCVWLFYNGCFQFDYADKCLFFAFWTKQREVLKHRITAYPRSCLVSANRTQYPFITQSWSPHYSLWWDKLSQSTVALTGNCPCSG